MAFTTTGGLIKIANGIRKIFKGSANGDPVEVTKGVVKVARGTARTLGGVITGKHYEGGETKDEADEEY